jgi:methionyl-tRNA formyltransferase
MKVVFMGTPDFAVGTLNEIIRDGHEVLGVVTQPDKPKGRGGSLQMPPVKEVALEHGIRVWQPVKVRGDEAFLADMKALKPDVIVVVAFGQILPKELLEIPSYGCVNVHASLLPEYRGAAPIQWAVIDGLKETGVTTMLMNEGLDCGDIIMQEKVVLDDKETGGSLFDKLSLVGAGLLVKTLKALEDGSATYTAQDDSRSSYARMLDKSLGELDFTKDAVELERLVRGLNPWPSAYTRVNGKILKIWDADVADLELIDENEVHGYRARTASGGEGFDTIYVPGDVCGIGKDAFYVQCGNGVLKVNEVQLEGKKRMCSADFLRGCRLEAGQRLG